MNLIAEARLLFARAQERHTYGLAQRTLYEMCRSVPGHNDVRQTASKLWLIGRSHAAALERRADATGFTDPYPQTARKLAADRSFHSLLRRLRRRGPRLPYLGSQLSLMHEAATHLTNVFHETTGLRKVSLATKYLHFHAPAVPICDSLTTDALRLLVPRGAIHEDAQHLWDLDHDYGKYLARFASARIHLSRAGISSTARTLDTFLLYWHAANPRRAK